MHARRSVLASLWLLMLSLTASTHASFLSTLLFGKDTLDPVRAAIRQTEQLRSEVYGWYHHNTTQQANFTVTPDPPDVYKLLPSTYSGRSLVKSDGSYYSDIEGYYKGDWSGWDYSTVANRSLALESRLNRTAAVQLSRGGKEEGAPRYVDGVNEQKLIEDRGEFGWTTVKPGHVDFHLKEEHLLKGNVSLIKGSASFTAPVGSKSSVDSVDFSLEGLHFLPTGSLFLHAVADEAPLGTDVRTTLGMIPGGNNETANATVAAMDKAFQLRIDMLQRIMDSGSYDAGDTSGDAPKIKHNCTFHIYAQLESAWPSLQASIDTLEAESLVPTGISTIRAPPLHLSLLAYSPECRILLSTTKAHPLAGLLQTTLWRKAIHYGIIYFLVLFLQTYLLVQQMEATTTPSGLSKVSDKTWLAQSILDAYACLIHLSMAVALENETTAVLIACSFMSGMCFLAFGYRYTITIYRTQMDTTPTPTPTPAVTQPDATAQQGGTGQTNTNAHATAATTTTGGNVASPTPEEIRARRRGMNILGVGLFLFMVGFFPLLTVALMLPFLYSFWIPQIYRNVQRGTSKAILKRCVIGTTLTRLFVPLYVLVCPDNVLFNEPSIWGWLLAAYLVLQAAVLVGQDVFGPHWFLLARWVPQDALKGWEYHPPLSGEALPEESYGDCAICLASIEKRVRRRNRPLSRGGMGRWFDLFSNQGYDRIADDAQDYELDSDEESQPTYPPEKLPRHRRDPPPGFSNGGSDWTRSVRSALARSIRTALRWRRGVNVSSTLRRRRMDVMVAPCHHAFHTECLERWLQIKNECPSCRSGLPPV